MPRSMKILRLSIFATLTVLLLIGGRLSLFLFPPDQSAARESISLRNSLIAKVGKTQDFVWSPKNVPKDFLLETLDAPEYFKSVSEGILEKATAEATNFDKAILIARHLDRVGGKGGAIRSNSRDAHERIITKGQGLCSDLTQVFNALAIASGIPVREWGMTDGGDAGGVYFHSFNEIYEPSLGKWVLVDSYFSFFVRDSRSGTPLSAMQFQDILLENSHDKLTVVPIVEERADLELLEAKTIDYYRRGIDMLYLFGGNNVFSFDANSLVREMARLSRSLELATAIILGVHPRMWILPNESNRQRVRELFVMRRNFLLMMVTGFVLGVALIWQIFAYTRVVRGGKASRTMIRSP